MAATISSIQGAFTSYVPIVVSETCIFVYTFSLVYLHITSWLPWVICNGILVGLAVAYRDQDSQYGARGSWKPGHFFCVTHNDPVINQSSPCAHLAIISGIFSGTPKKPKPWDLRARHRRESGTPPTWPLPRHIETPHGDTKRSNQYWLIMVNH